MASARRIGRITLWLLAGLVGLALIAVAAGIAYLNTDGGAARTARMVSALASSAEAKTTIGHIRLVGLSRIAIDDVVLADREGPWLRVGRVGVQWRPSALLRAAVHVETIDIADVAVQRKPLPGPEKAEEKPGGITIPHIPTQIRVDRLTIAPITLAAPVLGEAMAFRLDAALGAETDQAVMTHALLVRTDQPTRIALDIAYRPGDPSLDLKASIDEPAGGLIARMANLPGTPPVSLQITGTGPLNDWHGTLTASLPRLLEAKGQLTGAFGAPGGFGGGLNMQFGPLMPAAVTQALGDHADLDLAATRDADGTIALTKLTLTAPNAALNAHGTVNQARERIDGLDLTVEVPDGARLQPLLGANGFGAATLTVHAEGPLSGPDTRIILNARDVSVPGTATIPRLTVQADLVPPIGADAPAEVPITLAIAADDPHLAQAALAGLIGNAPRVALKARWNRAAGMVRLTDLAVTGKAIKAAGSGTYALASQAVDAKLTMAVDPISAAGAGANGKAQAEITIQGALTGALKADLTARAEHLAMPSAPAVAILGPNPEVVVHATRQADGTILLSSLRVAGAHVGLESRDCAIAATVSCSVTGHLDSLSPLSKPGTPLAGRVTLKLDANGPRADPLVTLSVAARDGRFGATTFRALTADARVENPAGDAKGTLAIALDAPAGAARLSSAFALSQQRQILGISDLRLTGPGVTANGDATVALKPGLARGTLDLRVTDAGQIAALFGITAGGRANAHIVLSDQGGKQGMQANLHAEGLTARTGPDATYSLASLDLRAEGKDLRGAAARLSADLRGSRIAGAGVQLDTLSATANGTPQQIDLRAALAGAVQRPTGAQPVKLTLAGQIARSATETAIRLDQFNGGAFGVPLALRAPARITLAPAGTRIEGLNLGVATGSVTVSGQVAKEAVALDLALRGLPASVFAAVNPNYQFSGKIDGTATVTARPGGGQGRLAIRFADIKPVQSGERQDTLESIPALSGQIDGTWDGRRAQVSARVAGLSKTDATLRAEVPLVAPPDSAIPALVSTAPLSAHLDWRGQIAPLWALTPMVEHRLDGEASVVADVGGTIAAPRVSATAQLTNARYEHLIWGTVLDHLTLNAQVRTDQDAQISLSGTDGAKGTLKGQARVGLQSADHPVDATIDLRNFVLARRDEATGSANAHITVTGPAKTAQIAGTITTEKVEIGLASNLPPSVVTLPVEQINGPPGNAPAAPAAQSGTIQIRSTPAASATPAKKPEPAQTQTGTAPEQAASEPPAAGMPLNLRVRLPHGVFVRGKGLESEWKGALTIEGTSQRPRIFGTLQLVRGDISIAGKTIALDSSSTIRFPGTTSIDPLLNLTATITGNTITGTLNVTGQASQPKIALTSSPELPQDEILSQVLFGKSTANLSPFEAVQLAGALADLSGVTGSGPGFLGRMRAGLGLDVLRIQSNAEGQTTVGAGKYVSKRVYVGVQQGMEATSGQVTVNIDVTRHLSIQTDVGAGAQSRAGVNWKFDY